MTTEKKLVINLKPVKKAYDRMELQYVAFIMSEFNFTDGLTNIKKNAILSETLLDCLPFLAIQPTIFSQTENKFESDDEKERA